MRKNVLLIMAACGSFFFANNANAQETVVVEEETVVVSDVECKDHYYSTWRDNWFIEVGAGVTAPFMECGLPDGSEKHHMTAIYNVGFGKWISPYLGWRFSAYYGAIHWDAEVFNKARFANANIDFMWDMCNSIGGVNYKRPVSVIPYVGLGGALTYDFGSNTGLNVVGRDGKIRKNSWTLPVSAGIQFKFRLCKYVDFFLEGRAWFFGDNFNNAAYGRPVDINIAALGGFNFKIGGDSFKSYNPCNDLAYIGSLNGQINTLRGDLAATAAALAAAEAQLPCPEVVVQECPEVAAPMLTTVRFTINSAKISDIEMVNVYNVAEYMKANPELNVIIRGYADKDTGTSTYNKGLSQRRAQAVSDALTNKYGINPSRLSIEAEGSETQVYDTNNWNRIVIFVPAE